MEPLSIFLDAGHGIETPGKRSKKLPDGRQLFECVFNRFVCEHLVYLGDSCGIKYIYPFYTHDKRLSNRVKWINELNNIDLILSIHANALSRSGEWQTKAHGPRFIVAKNASDTSRLAAKCIHDSMATLTKDVGSIYRERDLYIVSRTRPPAVLIECGFMDNLEDADLMLDVPGLYANLIHKGNIDLVRRLGR